MTSLNPPWGACRQHSIFFFYALAGSTVLPEFRGLTVTDSLFVCLCIMFVILFEDITLFSTQVKPTIQPFSQTGLIPLILEALITSAWFFSCLNVNRDMSLFLTSISAFCLLKLFAGFSHWAEYPDNLDWRFYRYLSFLLVPAGAVFCWKTPCLNADLQHLVVFSCWAIQTLLWWGFTKLGDYRDQLLGKKHSKKKKPPPDLQFSTTVGFPLRKSCSKVTSIPQKEVC